MSSGEEQGVEKRYETKYTISVLGLKVLELCLSVLCIGLIDDPATNSQKRTFITQRTIGLSYATYGAFIIYTGVYLLMRAFKDRFSWKTSALMSLIGFILYLTSASMLFSDWSYLKQRNYWPPNTQRLDFICATASLAIIESLVFLLDLILTIRFGMRGDID